MLAQQQVTEKSFQINWRIVYSQTCILVVGPHQCITEIPRMLGKEVVADVESYRTKILYRKDSCCASITLAKSMYLPKPRDEASDMSSYFVNR